MLKQLAENTHLREGEAQRRRDRNLSYMMRLKTENILFSHYFEAGLKSYSYKPENIHWGWDSPTSEIRGTFAGHWLSAAAMIYAETKDAALKQRADYMVDEIGRCQEENGGQWAFPIPEKYLYWLKRGKNIWAPQYVCQKNMTGLLDMYLYAGNKKALEIVKKCAEWFYDYTNDISRELMNEMMEQQETGAMMFHWANLYAVTGDKKHLELMQRYERPLLFDALLAKKDILTNMHVNTTIPEILGAARAYEVTQDRRYRKIVENYWELAVDKRGCFATGGQSSGEVWTPPKKQSARIGKMTQEHCTVFHMMMLAEYLFRWTGESKYADYWERNLYNGIFAQGYWESHNIFQLGQKPVPEKGLVAYYLPLGAGSRKIWGTETEDFWCCHCTLLQANSAFYRAIYYRGEQCLTVAQYIPSETYFYIGNKKIEIIQTEGCYAGETIRIVDAAYENESRPDYFEMIFNINIQESGNDNAAGKSEYFTVKLRIPQWAAGETKIYINGEACSYICSKGFACIQRQWCSGDKINIFIPKKLSCQPLADRRDTVAFMEGPVVLAGICDREYLLYGDIKNPETILTVDDEREWNHWNNNFRTVNQPKGIKFKPLYEIGNETYTVYFQVKDILN